MEIPRCVAESTRLCITVSVRKRKRTQKIARLRCFYMINGKNLAYNRGGYKNTMLTQVKIVNVKAGHDFQCSNKHLIVSVTVSISSKAPACSLIQLLESVYQTSENCLLLTIN